MPTTYVSRISQWIEKRFNAKGGNVITDIDPTATVQLSFVSGVEDLYLKGWNRFIGAAVVVAVAGQFSRFQLLNPVGSNVIAVVESLFFAGTQTIDYSIANGQANLATLQAPGTLLRRLDSRSGFTDSTCTLSTDTNATGFPGAANVQLQKVGPAEAFLHTEMLWTLLPKDSLFVITDVVNSNLRLNVQWRERALEQSELT